MPVAATRSESVNVLDGYRAARLWQECAEQYFRAVYDLPRTLQMALAVSTLERYLEVIESRKPKVTWPRQLLGDPQGWIETHGRSVPGEPHDPGPADAVFLNALDGVLLGTSMASSKSSLLTIAYAYSVVNGIAAKAVDAWAVDDPEAARNWQVIASGIEGPARQQALEGFAGRGYAGNAGASNVREMEWNILVIKLRDMVIGNYPPVQNAEEMERELREWKNREMLLPPDSP